MCVHELREYQLSLAAIGRLLRQVDLDELSIKTEQFREGYVDRLIVLIQSNLTVVEVFIRL